MLGLVGAVWVPAARAQAAGGDIYQAIVKREYGTAMEALAAIESEIQNARPEQYAGIEQKLLGVLESPEATVPAKQFVCQMLKTVGSSRCIQAVAPLLMDEKLSHVARNVLVGLREPAAEEVLIEAVAKTQGNVRIGLVNSLGDRGEGQALACLKSLLTGPDEAAGRAALNAVGKIGGGAGADVLESTKVAEGLKEAWGHACLRCAGSLAASDPSRSEKMLQGLLDGAYPPAVRAAAFPALARIQKENAVPAIIKVLSSDDKAMRQVAATAVVTVPGQAATHALMQSLAALPPEGKVRLLGALAARGDAAGEVEPLNKLAADPNAEVREAAIRALAPLGNASSVPVLAAALPEGGSLSASAVDTLVALQGGGVAEAMVQQLASGSAPVKAALFGVLVERRDPVVLPAARKALAAAEPEVRRAACKALGILGAREDFVQLAEELPARKENADQDQMAQAMSDIAKRMPDRAGLCEAVVQALGKADAQAKVNLVAVLASLGDAKALQVVRGFLNEQGEVKKAALRTLSEWPDAAPMDNLLNVAKSDKEKSCQVLALRGYVRMVGLSRNKPEQKVQAYREAMTLCLRTDEKRLVLNGLSEMGQVEALRAVELFLEAPELQSEAYMAYEKIAEAIARSQPAAAREALQRVVDKAPDKSLRNKAQKALDRIKK